MHTDHQILELSAGTPWTLHESGFAARDGTRLFYRHWAPTAPRGDRSRAHV